MTTATFETVSSIGLRIDELRLLVNNAKNSEDTDEKLYNTLCRACCVLIASHLEGFLKDLSSDLLSDLNYHLATFRNMPVPMKRAFCTKIAYYEGVEDREIAKRVTQLINFFDNNSVAIDLKAFTYKENPNKNPSGTFVDTTFERFGIESIVSSLAIPSLEAVFGGHDRQFLVLEREMRRLRSHLYKYPFKKFSTKYSFPRIKKKQVTETLWHSFIEGIMDRRHNIAHGDVTENVTTWEQLSSDVDKLHILMHGLAYSAASAFSD